MCHDPSIAYNRAVQCLKLSNLDQIGCRIATNSKRVLGLEPCRDGKFHKLREMWTEGRTVSVKLTGTLGRIVQRRVNSKPPRKVLRILLGSGPQMKLQFKSLFSSPLNLLN